MEGCYLKIGICRGLSISCVSNGVHSEKKERKLRTVATADLIMARSVTRECIFNDARAFCMTRSSTR